MVSISKKLVSNRELIPFVIIPSIVLLLLFFFFKNFNVGSKYLLVFFIVPLLLLLLLNIKIIYRIFILSFFFEYGMYYFYLPTLIFPFVAISFLLVYSVKYSEMNNSVLKYLLIFLISIVPSYFMGFSHPEMYLISYNLIAFISIIFITPLIIKDMQEVKNLAALYLIGSSLNAIYLIIMAILSGRREFGFAGIMYVDLVGIAIILAYSGVLFMKRKRIISIIVTLLLFVALLFTQTRNAWLSTGVVILMLTVDFVIRHNKLNIKNSFSIKKLVPLLITIVIIISSIQLAYPEVFSRVTQTRNYSTEELAVTMDFGSIATRFFIWQIAYSVFLANPIIGTGFHSFRFISYDYSKLNPFLYETFVKNLTPHTTILALLADTGIIGFLGFIIFLYLTIKFFRGNLKLSITPNQKIISFILYWCQIYIIVSMIMTDAWLWGTLHMLWAVILGIAVFLRNDIKITQKISSSSD